MDFKPGETVQLKSGGPIMTIRHFDHQDKQSVHCEWFDNNVPRRHEFPLSSLKKYEEAAESIF